MNDPIVEKKPSGRLSQAVIAIESIIYSIGLFILYIPVYLAVYGGRAIIFLALAIPAVIVWLIEKAVLPVLYIIYHSGYFIFKYIIYGIKLLFVAICASYIFMRGLWRKINWCPVRSGIRILAIIGIIGAIYSIIEGTLQLPPGTVIITGHFFDANGTVFRIHEAIALLMISITAFYNAWAYSREEEVSFICSHTFGVSALCKIRDKVRGK